MKKSLFSGVFVAIAILILFLFLFRNRSPFGKINNSFASDPKKEITRIELSQGRQNISLKKDGESWLLNGKSETRRSGILFMIRILKEIKIKSPVSSELFYSEVIGKEIVSVKVKVFEKRKLIRSFLVYKTRSNIYGNIMKMSEGAKPFIVYVPGYDGNIGSGFTLNELFWKPYTIFNLLPSEIASVDFENLSDETNSFTVINKNHHYILTDREKALNGWDSTLVTRYLSYFTWIPFESWALEVEKTEQKIIESQKPLYRITVISTKGTKTILTLWERLNGDNKSGIKDSDRLFGKIQTMDELFIIRYFDVDPILKKRSYFFPE